MTDVKLDIVEDLAIKIANHASQIKGGDQTVIVIVIPLDGNAEYADVDADHNDRVRAIELLAQALGADVEQAQEDAV